ncbi:hypothetical protein WA588_004603 [Blastocystis sp. NMH]
MILTYCLSCMRYVDTDVTEEGERLCIVCGSNDIMERESSTIIDWDMNVTNNGDEKIVDIANGAVTIHINQNGALNISIHRPLTVYVSHLSVLLQFFFRSARIDLDGSLSREGSPNLVGIFSNRVADVMESLSIPSLPRSSSPTHNPLQDMETRSPTEEELASECPICLKSYAASDALLDLPCSHSFHQSCVLKWMEIDRTCPLCRQSVN